MEIMSVDKGAQTRIYGKKTARAERKLERRKDEEEADKDERSRTRRTNELDGMS
jgi:hypothetical protein